MTDVAEQKRERWQRWYATVKNDPTWLERRQAAKRAAYERNRNKVLAANRKWAVENPEKVRAIARRFYQQHIEEERQRSKNKNPEKRREASRLWRRANPLKRAAKEGKRRAQKRATETGRVDYEAIVRDAEGICALCGKAVVNEPSHIDHIVPLSKGGSHTQDNLQFTHARCNLAKGAKLLKAAG